MHKIKVYRIRLSNLSTCFSHIVYIYIYTNITGGKFRTNNIWAIHLNPLNVHLLYHYCFATHDQRFCEYVSRRYIDRIVHGGDDFSRTAESLNLIKFWRKERLTETRSANGVGCKDGQNLYLDKSLEQRIKSEQGFIHWNKYLNFNYKYWISSTEWNISPTNKDNLTSRTNRCTLVSFVVFYANKILLVLDRWIFKAVAIRSSIVFPWMTRDLQLTVISAQEWSIKVSSDSSPAKSTLTVFSPESSSVTEEREQRISSRGTEGGPKRRKIELSRYN